MYGIALIAVLAVTGGVIAYIGDKLGTKVGKKKLSIFGLRPKHTSILVTIVTGILIASSTLGILTLVSHDVRTALFGMEALKAELHSLSQEVTSQNNDLESSRKALAEKTKEYAVLSQKILDTSAKLKGINEELSAVRTERDQVSRELGRVQDEYAAARGDLESSKQEIAALQTTKTALDSRVADLSEAKSQLQGDVDRLDQLTGRLKQGIQVMREGSIIYRAGEVLSTNVLPAGEQRADLEYALKAVMYKTNQEILDRLGASDRDVQVLWISPKDFEDAVNLLTRLQQDVIVRISSAGNAVYGEHVFGRIELFPNRRIYSNRQKILSQTFDGTQKSKEAETMLLLFLQQVNGAAIKQGVLPDPLKGTVGVMDGNQLFEAVNKVKRVYTDKVKLTATADGDIYTAGPLRITLHVQSVPTP